MGRPECRHAFIQVRPLGADIPMFVCERCGYEQTVKPKNAAPPPKVQAPRKGSSLPPTPLEVEMMRQDLIDLSHELEAE